MSSSADRLRAAHILVRTEGGAYASRLLGHGGAPGVRARVLGVLRWQRALDWVLSRRCRRPLEELDPEVRATLRIGLYEAVHLGVPHAVATDGAVHLAHRLGRSSAGGLVNAVLRRSVAEWPEEMERAGPDLRLSHPEWLYRRWASRFGNDAALRAMDADQQPAPLWVWFIEETAESRLRRSGVVLEPHPWCPGAFRSLDRASDLAAAVADGTAYAQDPSSQLVALFGARLDLPGRRFADLCAAPGGKSARLLALGRWSRGVALDISLVRARLMAPLLERSGACPIAVADATRPPLAGHAFDLVLLDAPCTGTGTLRRHPELRWRLRPEAITEMAAAQRAMIAAALQTVSEGGVLLYATCSVEAEENEVHFSSPVDGFETVDLGEALPGQVPCSPTGARGIRILPRLDGDGFTIHALRRNPRRQAPTRSAPTPEASSPPDA